MKVMIVGGGGLLGQKLIQVIKRETTWDISSVIRSGIADAAGCHYFDTMQKKAWKEMVLQERWRPDVIINAAAMTEIEECEAKREEAWKSNVQLVETLTELCRKVDSTFVQLSTDQIFEGSKGPYYEDALPKPLNYFGKTKLAAENVCLQSGVETTIVRTMWVYGDCDTNSGTFIEGIIRANAQRRPLAIAGDQFGTPTLSDDVAFAIIKLIEKKYFGIWHIAGPDLLSRWDYARAVVNAFGLERSALTKVETSELEGAAYIPLRSGLISQKAQSLLGLHPLSLRYGLGTYRIQKERRVWNKHAV